MITDIASYLRFFDSVRRRTERDVAALPPAAAAWRPPAGAGGEAGWNIGQIVGHIGRTGNASSPGIPCHLHFEVHVGSAGGRAINPQPYLRAWDRYS